MGATIANIVSILKLAPAISPNVHFSSRRGAVCGLDSVNIRMDSIRKIETPIAEIRDANRLAPRDRRRRYATNSTSTPKSAQAIIEPTRAMTSV